MDQFDVFLSYNSSDKPDVRRLAKALQSRGLRVWFDEWELRPGMPWQETLEAVIQGVRATLVIIGEPSIGPWQVAEVNASLELFVRDRRPVIPLLLPGAPEIQLPIYLSTYTALRLNSWDDIAPILDRIVWAVTGKSPTELPEKTPIPKLFLCHAKEDDEKVGKLYYQLRDLGIDPWYDKEKLIVGDRWEDEIINAIEKTDFFAMCFSETAIQKTGFIQREIKVAVREYQKRPQQLAFLLPVRIEPCKIPPIKLDDLTNLNDYQWIDLFGDSESLTRFVDGVKQQFDRNRQNST